VAPCPLDIFLPGRRYSCSSPRYLGIRISQNPVSSPGMIKIPGSHASDIYICPYWPRCFGGGNKRLGTERTGMGLPDTTTPHVGVAALPRWRSIWEIFHHLSWQKTSCQAARPRGEIQRFSQQPCRIGAAGMSLSRSWLKSTESSADRTPDVPTMSGR
jgi:hypothetical protein